MSQARAKAVKDAINGAMKKDVITMGSDDRFQTRLLPTGVLPIDILLQGGVARGRMTGISGTWSSLKTLIALRLCGTTQAGGDLAGFIDSERTFDRDWATQAGVNTTDLLYVRPQTGEEGFDALEAMIRSRVGVVVVDSVSALLPQSEREQAMADEKTQPGVLARLMSKGLRKVTAANEDTAIVWLNQTRMQIGMTFGNPETATGGMALPFYLSQHVVMRKTAKVTMPSPIWNGEAWIKDSKVQVAQRFSASLEKSKLNMPQRAVHFEWDFRSAEINLPGFLIGQCLELGLVAQKGSSWSFDGVKAVGRQKFVDKVAADPELMRKMENAVRQAHQMPLSSYRGTEPRPKSEGARPRAVKRSGTARGSTPAAAAGASGTTPRRRKSSTSSSKPSGRSR